eukprot:7054120-Alexandrium_andersonii.AAC.1
MQGALNVERHEDGRSLETSGARPRPKQPGPKARAILGTAVEHEVAKQGQQLERAALLTRTSWHIHTHASCGSRQPRGWVDGAIRVAVRLFARSLWGLNLSLIHISEPTRLALI